MEEYKSIKESDLRSLLRSQTLKNQKYSIKFPEKKVYPNPINITELLRFNDSRSIEKIIIRNAIFEEDIELGIHSSPEDKTFPNLLELEIVNCKFEKKLHIHHTPSLNKITLNNLNRYQEEVSEEQSLIINDQTTETLIQSSHFSLVKLEKTGNIKMIDTQIGRLNVLSGHSIQIEGKSIIREESQIGNINYLQIIDSSFHQHLEVSNQKESLLLQESTFQAITFKNLNSNINTVSKHRVEDCQINKIEFLNFSIHIGVDFKNTKIKETLVFKGNKGQGINGIHLYDCEIASFVVEKGASFKQQLSNNSNKSDVPKKEKGITFLNESQEYCGERIEVDLDGFDFLNFKNLQYKNIILSGEKGEFQNIHLERIKVDEFEFKNLKNRKNPEEQEESIYIHQLSVNDKLKFENTTFEDTKFTNCDFSELKHIHFSNSILSKAEFIGTDWNTRLKINEDFKSQNKFQEAREAGKQLKQAATIQGDKIQETLFKAKELKAYFHMLSWKKNFFSKLNLLLNKCSNNFGISWSRGILFTFLISVFFYFIYLFSLQGYKLFQHPYPISFYIKHYFLFLNPVHPIDFMITKPKVNAYMTFTDYLGRIFIGFGIYQTVLAFRRFGK